MSYIRGTDRNQTILFTPALDATVAADHPARFIDAFVDGLDVGEMGFERAIPRGTGRPGYDPRDLLKLHVFGATHEVRSSRALEREAGRRLELAWLLRGLEPDFKTIADFRRNHREALEEVLRLFRSPERRPGGPEPDV